MSELCEWERLCAPKIGDGNSDVGDFKRLSDSGENSGGCNGCGRKSSKNSGGDGYGEGPLDIDGSREYSS